MTFCVQQCWRRWNRVLGVSMQLVRRMGGWHLLLVGAGEVRDGGVAGVLHPLLLLPVLPLSRRGGTICPGRAGPALLRQINSYLEKYVDLKVKSFAGLDHCNLHLPLYHFKSSQMFSISLLISAKIHKTKCQSDLFLERSQRLSAI